MRLDQAPDIIFVLWRYVRDYDIMRVGMKTSPRALMSAWGMNPHLGPCAVAQCGTEAPKGRHLRQHYHSVTPGNEKHRAEIRPRGKIRTLTKYPFLHLFSQADEYGLCSHLSLIARKFYYQSTFHSPKFPRVHQIKTDGELDG